MTATQKSSLSTAQAQALTQAQQGDNYVTDSATSAPTNAPVNPTTQCTHIKL